MDDYTDASLNRVIRPQPLTAPVPAWCGREASKSVRMAVVQLRRYLSLECGYGFGWDASDEGWQHAQVRMFVDTDTQEPGVDWLIGIAVFDTEDAPFLSAAWIHPFYRGRGLLKAAWPEFVNRFGQFEVDKPNRTMKTFLRAVGHSEEQE